MIYIKNVKKTLNNKQKMKRSINIGKNKYSIRKVKVIEKNPDVLGKIKHDRKQIYIKKQNRKVDKETLYHEIAHGIIVNLAVASIDNDMKLKKIKLLGELNNDEWFIEYFGNLLRKTFKLK